MNKKINEIFKPKTKKEIEHSLNDLIGIKYEHFYNNHIVIIEKWSISDSNYLIYYKYLGTDKLLCEYTQFFFSYYQKF